MDEDRFRAGDYWLDPTNEHVMVWYQMESLKDFVKLYGRIDGTLKAGKTYVFTIQDNYRSDLIDNEKYLYLSEVSTFGGKNYVLSYFFMLGSIVCLMVLLFFVVLYFLKVSGRRAEDESYIKNLTY